MKNSVKALIATILAVAATGTAIAQTTQKLTATKASEYGLIYTLPNTVFDITFETRHTKKQPGEFANYSRRYLADDDAISQPSQSANLVSVTLNARGIPNPANRWIVQFKAGSTPFMILDPAGVPLAVNTEEVKIPEKAVLPVAVAPTPTPLETPAAKQAITQEMVQSSSMSKRAELAAQRIYELRGYRSDLMAGEAENTPPDGQSLKLALDNISQQEAALTAMFAGTTSTYTQVKTISFTPDSVDLTNHVIARVSPTKGIVPADDLSGTPIYLTYTIKEKPTLPVNEKGVTKAFPKGGLAYNIPGVASISISYNGNTLYSADVAIAQLGVTFGIDPGLFTDKKAPAFVQFNPITGGITEIGTK